MVRLPNLSKILADIEKASEDEHPDPLTAPYDTLQSFPQAGSGEPYINTDSSSDIGSSGSSCCSPTEDHETGPPPLPPARKPSPNLPHTVNGSIKGIQQQLLSNQNQKSISLPTSSSTSPMPGQNSSHSSNKDVIKPVRKPHKNPAQPSYSTGELILKSPTMNQSFSDIYGEGHPSNLDDAIANVYVLNTLFN